MFKLNHPHGPAGIAGAPMLGDDQLAPVRTASARVVQRVLTEVRDNRGVRVEDALGALGALMGYSAVDSLFYSGNLQGVNAITTADGTSWFFGHGISGVLLDGKGSALQMVNQAVVRNRGEWINPSPMVKRTAQNLGTAAYGVPDVPKINIPRLDYRESVQRYWPLTRQVVGDVKPVQSWPYVFVAAFEQVLTMSRGAIDPTIAGRIVFEYALPASHLDPRDVFAGSK